MKGMILIVVYLCLHWFLLRKCDTSRISKILTHFFILRSRPHNKVQETTLRETRDILKRPSHSTIIVPKIYRYGQERTEADFSTVSTANDRTFASATESQASMTDWNALVVQPAINEEGEPEMPDETMPGPMPQPSPSAEIRDPEVHTLLGSLEVGERVITSDATDEELQAIENFDMRAYV